MTYETDKGTPPTAQSIRQRCRHCTIILASGDEFSVEQIRLFDAGEVAQIFALKQNAQALLGGVSTGIGFWGSPGWVVGGALALGLLESLLSQGAAKKGAKALAEAYQREQSLRQDGRFFPISEIDGLEEPAPCIWAASAEIAVRSQGALAIWSGRSLEASSESRRFVHNGDEFITFVADEKIRSVRWSSVTTYQVT